MSNEIKMTFLDFQQTNEILQLLFLNKHEMWAENALYDYV